MSRETCPDCGEITTGNICQRCGRMEEFDDAGTFYGALRELREPLDEFWQQVRREFGWLERLLERLERWLS